jgi:hypothetical protein
MGAEGKKRGVYSRRKTEDPKFHDRDRARETEAWEYSTGRKMRAGICEFWKARNSDEVPRPGSWFWHEDDVGRKWIRKPQEPLPPIASAPKETPYQEFKRLARERDEAEAMERHWQEEWDRDMAEIERERRTKERRAAGLIRRRHNKRDALQATPEGKAGLPEGTPPCFGVP